MKAIKLSALFFLFSFYSLFGSDIVIELLVTDHDNKFWKTKNQMHMTIGHIKNVDDTKFIKTIEVFNNNNRELLQKSVNEGFTVKYFNNNGFNNGYHILEANPDTTARFAFINSKLYDFLIVHSFGTFTDKTTPKTINPKGYTPHIEFLETTPEKIPVKGDVIHFKDWHLQWRIVKSA
jgi:hypothetical protein